MKTKKTKRIRADQHLVDEGHAQDRRQAETLIRLGMVSCEGRRIDKPGELVAADTHLHIKGSSQWVGRGAHKLGDSFDSTELRELFYDKIILDIGASTGGFTQQALSCGATQVIALDVGKAQLAWSLKTHPQVISLESTDVRAFDSSQHPPIDTVLADVSFNSLARLAPAIYKTLDRGQVLLLVKPQFELPSTLVPKGGIVINRLHQKQALETVIQAFTALGAKLHKQLECFHKGRGGNQEYFVWFVKK